MSSLSSGSTRLSAVALFLLIDLACSTDRSIGPAEVVALQALELSTTYAPHQDTLGAFSGTVQFHNPSDRPVSVILRSPCPLIVRAYRLDVGVTSAAWDQERYPGGCKSFPFEFAIDAGATRSLPFGPIDASMVLNDSLPSARYRLAVFIAERGGPSQSGAELTVTTAVLKPS
jgi:hypothetical protein